MSVSYYPILTEEEEEYLFIFMVDIYKILAKKYPTYSEKELTAVAICFIRGYSYTLYSVDTLLKTCGYDDINKEYCLATWHRFVCEVIKKQPKQWRKICRVRSNNGLLKAIKELE